MSLECAILCYLTVKPETGYDLMRRFDRSASVFWTADKSRIYRTLEKLHEGGFVEREIVKQESRPDRKLFHITEKGEKKLCAWFAEAKAGSPLRSSWLVQLYFLGLVSPEAAIRLLEDKRKRILETLAGYPVRFDLTPGYESDEPADVDFFHWLVLDSAVHVRYALIEWIDGAIARIRNGDYQRGRDAALTRWPPYDGQPNR